jgi:hypothetical protein
VGWLLGALAMLALGWEHFGVCLFMIGIFVLPIWLFVLLPLYVLLPRSSRLWHPALCTVCGAITGAAILSAYFALAAGGAFDLLYIFLPIGVVVGGVTCFVGAATARYFHGTRTA